MIRPPKRECSGRMEPGEDLVVAGYMGQKGTRELIRVFEKELSQWFSKRFLQEAVTEVQPDIASHLQKLMELGATETEPAGEGGIFKAIWDLSGAYRIGLTFFPRKIPVRQSTIEICERCGCNPYRLFCENCLVLAAENGGQIVEACADLGIPAAVIGHVEKGSVRKIRHGEETGYLERPGEDELYRVTKAGIFSDTL
jgi:hydrogenase expression/formation protein HypE